MEIWSSILQTRNPLRLHAEVHLQFTNLIQVLVNPLKNKLCKVNDKISKFLVEEMYLIQHIHMTIDLY